MSAPLHSAPPLGVAFSVTPKGVVHSPLRRGGKAPKSCRRESWEILELFPQFLDDLAGLGVGSQVLVLTYRAEAMRGSDLGLGNSWPDFHAGTESEPNLPNHPIRIDRVTILGIEGCRLQVRGLEVEDGTPILDLQPIQDGGENAAQIR